MATAPLLFINAGWQIRYQGPAADDPTLGGHGHLRTHSMGHEAWNFQPYKGRLYGYIPREAVVRIGNLGATSSDDHAAGVTVVWLARHPSTGRTVIVGWYRNATVHRRADAHVLARKGGYSVKYQIDAPADQAKLLLLDQRTFEIPTKKEKGCLGQSPVWYGANDAFRARVRAFIDRDGRHAPPAKKSVKGGVPRSNDPQARKRVELAAVAYATRYYKSIEGGERTVESVERDAVGWDLNAIGPADTLKVEVKGLTGTEPVVELTPNEYEAMRSPEHRNHYVIFIVTEAGTPSERAHIFRYDAEASTKKRAVWVSHSGRELQIEERTGARLRG